MEISLINFTELKQIFAVLALLITVTRRFPYIRDIFLKKVVPHTYTWLIWGITQGTATAVLWHSGGGEWSTIALTVSTGLGLLIFFLSLKYGTKNITMGDGVILLLSLLAIMLWWQLESPLLAILLVSAIDGLGYLPTYRKCWKEPHSETLTYWATGVPVVILLLLSLNEYSVLTVTYLATLGIGNTILVFLCLWRRKFVAGPLKA